MCIYSLVDRATGEEVEADKTKVERLTGIEITYINWSIEQDGKYEYGNWIITRINRRHHRHRQSGFDYDWVLVKTVKNH